MSVVIPVGTALPNTGHLIIMSDITAPSRERGENNRNTRNLKDPRGRLGWRPLLFQTLVRCVRRKVADIEHGPGQH